MSTPQNRTYRVGVNRCIKIDDTSLLEQQDTLTTGKLRSLGALTGMETDRLKEERERGLSIELGFAYFDLPDNSRAGIVDVPGHEKFIRSMLSGAYGMDIVLFRR